MKKETWLLWNLKFHHDTRNWPEKTDFSMNSLSTSSWHNHHHHTHTHTHNLKTLQIYNKGEIMKYAYMVDKYAAIENTNYENSKMFMVC